MECSVMCQEGNQPSKTPALDHSLTARFATCPRFPLGQFSEIQQPAGTSRCYRLSPVNIPELLPKLTRLPVSTHDHQSKFMPEGPENTISAHHAHYLLSSWVTHPKSFSPF